MLTLEIGSMCDVCMEEFDPRNLPHCIPCGHVLCLCCCNNILGDATLRLTPSCPFCREEFSHDTVRLVRVDFSTSLAQVHRDSGSAPYTSSSGTLVKAYLFAYNVLSAVGWMLVLYRTLLHLSTSSHASLVSSLLTSLENLSNFHLSIIPPHLVPLYRRACTTYHVVGPMTALVQSAAVLEVLHVRFGLVKKPLPATTMQVAGRLVSVWCIAARFRNAQRSPFYASMVLSWALTGVIRYTSYAASLFGWKFAPPIWTRYLTFLVLYPIGAGSEALINLATLPISVWFSILPFSQWDVSALLRGVLFVAWWPGLSLMYAHMIKQPRKVFVDAEPKTPITLIEGS